MNPLIPIPGVERVDRIPFAVYESVTCTRGQVFGWSLFSAPLPPPRDLLAVRLAFFSADVGRSDEGELRHCIFRLSIMEKVFLQSEIGHFLVLEPFERYLLDSFGRRNCLRIPVPDLPLVKYLPPLAPFRVQVYSTLGIERVLNDFQLTVALDGLAELQVK